jgi:nitrate/TMAO reductase-like tetraheme cytochrome c subunit
MARRSFKRQTKIFLATAVGTALLGLLVYVLVPQPADLGVDLDDVPYYTNYDDTHGPFWPSRVLTTDGRFANPQNISSAADCVTCHVEEFEQWASSLHAVSGRDAIYDATIEYNIHFKEASNGHEQIRFCEGCHEPGQVILGRTNRVPSVMPAEAETEGLTCIFCHAAVHADPIEGNGAYTIAMSTANDAMSDAMIMASPRDHAKIFGSKATNALIGTSDFCGACHTEHYNEEVSKASGDIPVQTTFAEWKDSWYAEQNVTCQDCHMNRDPAAFIKELSQGIVNPPDYHTHNFVGANYVAVETDLGSNLFWLRGGVIPGLTGERYLEILETQKQLTHDLLKSAAELEMRDVTLVAGAGGSISIAVKNVGAGHNLPTGVTDHKHMWLELEVTDATGKEFVHSGWFDGDRGVTDPDAVIWIERFWDENDTRITDHLTFNTAYIDFSRELIPPRGEDVINYDITLPDDVQGPVTIKAKLWYRAALQDLITNVVKASIIVPPFLLAETQAEISVSR